MADKIKFVPVTTATGRLAHVAVGPLRTHIGHPDRDHPTAKTPQFGVTLCGHPAMNAPGFMFSRGRKIVISKLDGCTQCLRNKAARMKREHGHG